jgi:hypothetical protein
MITLTLQVIKEKEKAASFDNRSLKGIYHKKPSTIAGAG